MMLSGWSNIQEVAHQDTIVTAIRGMQSPLCPSACGHKHEKALQGQCLPGGNDISAAAMERTQQAQQLQQLAQHCLVQNWR